MARKKIDRKDKKCHREFVWLAPAEYEHLCELLGKERTEKWIDDLNLYLGSKGDKYASHYYTIQVWARRSEAKTADTGSEALRGADRVIELLRNPQGQLPTDSEKMRQAVYGMLRAMQLNWPRLQGHLKEHPTIESRIRAAFLDAYSTR
jgi:hypothetical protein